MDNNCKTKNTVPTWVKNVGAALSGKAATATSVSVCCTKDSCTKTFRDKATYEREKNVYNLNLSYVPKMLSYDDEKQSITMQRLGEPLGTPFDAIWNKTHSQTKQIVKLNKQFTDDTGLYHNDIGFRNVLQDNNMNLYLIDFEHSSPENTDIDSDKILSNNSL